MGFKWYTAVKSSSQIEQGDLIHDCPIVIPPSKLFVGEEPEIEIKLIDSIILSQTCDLVNNKIEIVLVCPFYTLKTFIDNLPDEQKNTKKAIYKHIDNLKKGHLPGYHLLNKDSDVDISDYLVVDFKNVYGIQIQNIREIAKSINTRIRLLPPYREHLSQSFARYFMRVGLPQDIVIEGY